MTRLVQAAARSNFWFGGHKKPLPPTSYPVWPQPARSPLPSIPSADIPDWSRHPSGTPGVWVQAGHTYDNVWPQLPPTQPELKWLRGDYFGVRVPGIPLLPNMAGYTVSSPPWNQNREPYCPPIMAMDVIRYYKAGMLDVVDEIMNAHIARSYTHFQLSIGHCNSFGLTIDQTVELAIRLRLKMRYLDCWFLGGNWGKYWDDGSQHEEMRDRDRDYWSPILLPWIQALRSNGVMSMACKGWQVDNCNTQSPRSNSKYPNPWLSITQFFAEEITAHNIPLGCHYINEAGMVLTDDGSISRQQAWKMKRGMVSHWHHQGDVYCPVDEYQARLVDSLKMFGDGSCGQYADGQPFQLVVCEHSAQSQFDLWCHENEATVKGLRLTQTHAATTSPGYSGSASQVDGTAA